MEYFIIIKNYILNKSLDKIFNDIGNSSEYIISQ